MQAEDSVNINLLSKFSIGKIEIFRGQPIEAKVSPPKRKLVIHLQTPQEELTRSKDATRGSWPYY